MQTRKLAVAARSSSRSARDGRSASSRRAAGRVVASTIAGALALSAAAALPATSASAAPTTQGDGRVAAAAAFTEVTARVVSIDVPGQSAVLAGRAEPGTVLNIHPQGNPTSYVTGIVVASDGTWSATVTGLPVGTNNLLIDQRIPSKPDYLGRAYATVEITAPQIVVHYRAGDRSIADDTVVTGTPRADTTIKAVDIDGYHLLSSPATTTTSFGAAGSSVEWTWKYAADTGTVATRFVDGKGKELAEPTSTDGASGTEYTTTPATVDGWHVVTTPGDATGRFPGNGKTTTVTYVYALDMGEVVTRYVDADGKDLAEPSTPQSGHTGEAYFTESIAIPGYHLVGRPKNAVGDYPADGTTTTVRYLYALDLGTVVTRFVDESGKPLIAADSTSGPTGEAYTAGPADIPLYHLVDPSQSFTIPFPSDRDTVTVTYVYAHDEGTIRARFVDGDGTQLARSVLATGPTGDDYTAPPARVAGYHVVSSVGEATFPAHGTRSVITYTYALDMGTVESHFVDEQGVDLQPASERTGPTGTRYSTDPVAVDGHHVVAISDEGSGEFPADGVTVKVTYTYAVDMGTVTTTFVDADGRTLAPAQSQRGRTGTPYEAAPAAVDGYHLVGSAAPAAGLFPAHGTETSVTFVYAQDTASVVARYVDDTGRDLLAPYTQTGPSGSSYALRAPWIGGYVLVGTESVVTGTFGADRTTADVVFRYEPAAVVIPGEPTEPPARPTTPGTQPSTPPAAPSTPPVSPAAGSAGRTVEQVVHDDQALTPAATKHSDHAAQLAQTGAPANQLAALASLLMIGGVPVVVLASRRRRDRTA